MAQTADTSAGEQARVPAPGRLASNIGVLYGLQVANLVLPLINVPYLVRTLGASGFGRLAFATAVIAYLSAVIDFGFGFTATRAAAASAGCPAKLGRLLMSVTAARTGLLGVSLVALALFMALPRFSADTALFAASSLTLLGTTVFPGWILQGMEQMRLLAWATLVGRGASVLLTFLLVHGPGDVVRAAALQAACLLFSLAVIILPLLKLIPVRHWRVHLPTARALLSDSANVFVSSASVTMYTSGVTIVLGLLASAAAVGAFSAANKVAVAFCSLLWSPVSQAAYPRVAALIGQGNHDAAAQLLQKILRAVLPLGVLLAATLWLLAPCVVHFALGPGMDAAVSLLRILSALPALLVISNFFGSLVLYLNGFFSTAARIQLVVAVCSIGWVIPLVRAQDAAGAAYAAMITEVLITLAFVYACRTHGLLSWAGLPVRIGAK
jgi:PST family polysaccharide transporter